MCQPHRRLQGVDHAQLPNANAPVNRFQPLHQDPGLDPVDHAPVHTQSAHTPTYYRRRASRRRQCRLHSGHQIDSAGDDLVKRGKPGSRRHRRYLNRIFAHCSLPIASEGDEELDSEPVEFQWHSHFQLVGFLFFQAGEEAESPDSNECDESYDSCELDSPGHEGLLTDICGSCTDTNALDVDSMAVSDLLNALICNAENTTSAKMYRRIAKFDRRYLRNFQGSRLLLELEFLLVFLAYGRRQEGGFGTWQVVYDGCVRKIRQFAVVKRAEEDDNSLALRLNSSFHRKIAHIVAQYYNVKSISCESDNGRRLTFFRPRLQKSCCSRAPRRHSTTLSTYMLQWR